METKEIINTICASVGILLDLGLLFLILHNRRTITKINIIILNYSISDMLGRTVTLIGYSKQFLTQGSVCTLNSVEVLHQISVILLLFILVFGCIFELRMKDFFVLIGLTWALAIFVSVLFYVLCKMYNNSHPIDVIILTVYVTTTTIVAGKLVFNCFKNIGHKVIVDIVMIYMLLTSINIAQMMGYTPRIFSIMEWFQQPVEFLYPAVFCAYLFFIDKHIREFCLKCSKCNLRKSESTTNIAYIDSDANSVDLSYSRANEDMVS